jgi:hypothetical protein
MGVCPDLLFALRLLPRFHDNLRLTLKDTSDEEAKFVDDAKALTGDIISPSGAMGHVAHLLNVYAVFVPSDIVSPVNPPLMQKRVIRPADRG